MSTHYNTEPTATASATLHTTLGPLHIALFASQTPLTCRNFLQHIQDNYYTGTIFHRIIPNFILQGGDPTGTGSGGTSIYEEPEFEYDPTARDPNEKVVLRDELHSRLRFNRRGLVGMAKAEDGSYGSQFFITLGDASRELNGQCTLFGRIEGDSIYNVLKIAEGEVVEGTERPVYPIRVTGCEVGELGPLEGKIVKRDLTARSSATATAEGKGGKKAAQAKKKGKAKGGKTLLSFGDDEGEEGEEMPVRPAKPKYNAALVTDTTAGNGVAPAEKKPKARKASPSPPPRKRASPTPPPIDRPKSPDPATQLPLRDPESPERSPSPEEQPAQKSKLERTNAEIESLKASMRRTVTTESVTGRKKTALEAMIPQTAIRGRRRPPPGSSASTSASNGITGFSSTSDNAALKMFNAFKAKLENADSAPTTTTTTSKQPQSRPQKEEEEDEEDEESQLCDLHFIVNCQSCKSWSDNNAAGTDAAEGNEDTKFGDDTDQGWLTHQLRFGKDTLGKDLKWKKEHPDDVDSLMVIDPREKEKDIVASGSGSGRKKRGMMERDRERDRKRGRVGDLEWEKGRK